MVEFRDVSERSGANSPTHSTRGTKAAPPRSDTGTIVLHWLTVAAVLASLLTGLRIASDARSAVVSKFLAPALPQGEVWTAHFTAGVILILAASAYAVYMARARLAARIAPGRVRVLAMPSSSRLKWQGVNVVLHWAVYAALLALGATGAALYVGVGGGVVQVHSVLALAMLAYFVVHVFTHYMYGGLAQLLRLFRPAPLPSHLKAGRTPLLAGTAAGVLVAAGAVALDWGTRDMLRVPLVAEAPRLDGALDDPAWRAVRPVSVRTMQGANLGGTGESVVDIRAVRTADRIYFAFRWEDPTRSLRRLPVEKRQDGWHLVGADAGSADVADFYEDKFAVIFAPRDDMGAGGVTHLGPHPVPGKPPSLNDRGLHYTTDGSLIDMWQWKSSRGGLLGLMDDMYIGPPKDPTPDEAARRARYQGGYWPDPGKGIYSYNFPFEGPGGYKGPITPKRLPKDLKAFQAAMGPVDIKNPDSSDPEAAVRWMWEDESEPYSAEADAKIPVGAILPGVILSGGNEGDRGDLTAGAKWADGHWTLEVSRKLASDSPYDQSFEPGRPLYMWVTVFDHTQTRHTRHIRPVKLIVESKTR
ncbi:ethylbenzene dehydrogenase-related protein [Alsobacter sp. KACC 23698]|uniref:Ethylbenzene dehydrogenase-related protein n=1 Tax=Alsobacter sp. KACC 23698 TaxID=3149229 RepID=A0AAU7JJT0_9HYPH